MQVEFEIEDEDIVDVIVQNRLFENAVSDCVDEKLEEFNWAEKIAESLPECEELSDSIDTKVDEKMERTKSEWSEDIQENVIGKITESDSFRESVIKIFEDKIEDSEEDIARNVVDGRIFENAVEDIIERHEFNLEDMEFEHSDNFNQAIAKFLVEDKSIRGLQISLHECLAELTLVKLELVELKKKKVGFFEWFFG